LAVRARVVPIAFIDLVNDILTPAGFAVVSNMVLHCDNAMTIARLSSKQPTKLKQ
jgi:hypothetical protein